MTLTPLPSLNYSIRKLRPNSDSGLTINIISALRSVKGIRLFAGLKGSSEDLYTVSLKDLGQLLSVDDEMTLDFIRAELSAQFNDMSNGYNLDEVWEIALIEVHELCDRKAKLTLSRQGQSALEGKMSPRILDVLKYMDLRHNEPLFHPSPDGTFDLETTKKIIENRSVKSGIRGYKGTKLLTGNDIMCKKGKTKMVIKDPYNVTEPFPTEDRYGKPLDPVDPEVVKIVLFCISKGEIENLSYQSPAYWRMIGTMVNYPNGETMSPLREYFEFEYDHDNDPISPYNDGTVTKRVAEPDPIISKPTRSVYSSHNWGLPDNGRIPNIPEGYTFNNNERLGLFRKFSRLGDGCRQVITCVFPSHVSRPGQGADGGVLASALFAYIEGSTYPGTKIQGFNEAIDSYNELFFN